jgi:hypothetical protein
MAGLFGKCRFGPRTTMKKQYHQENRSMPTYPSRTEASRLRLGLLLSRAGISGNDYFVDPPSGKILLGSTPHRTQSRRPFSISRAPGLRNRPSESCAVVIVGSSPSATTRATLSRAGPSGSGAIPTTSCQKQPVSCLLLFSEKRMFNVAAVPKKQAIPRSGLKPAGWLASWPSMEAPATLLCLRCAGLPHRMQQSVGSYAFFVFERRK